MDKKTKSKSMVLIGVIFVSFASIFTKISSAPSLVIATYRLGFSSLMLLPYVLENNIKEIKGISKKDLFMCLISGVFLAFHFATWLESIKYTSITSSTVLVNTHPIFIVIGSFLILKEKVSKKAIMSIIIALIGSTIISLGDSSLGSNIFYGDLLAILGGFCVAGYMMIGRIARQRLSVNSYTFIVYSSCTLTLLLLSLITSTPLYPYPKTDWLIFLCLAVFCTILGHSIFNWSLEYLSPTFISTSILGEPVFATIWAMLIFKEIPTLWQILGGIIILLGIYRFIQVSENPV
ncbi:DMT family transporter [Paramaledivibacter caminithermalis]|jgi:drug/metabolite transporter (DMT)-like permease|uniref:Permease of the drug/metabolite transporter (DMT) superfamily n=1 Tax=Paramaledivibacter caminithermalis (strain DSM 15212 / CIP 107654 / DViRD3) TaxID=1121301 RepID=A0A1M6MRD8_PARC5|nr:DMT family transporter [Paramaledivibacter caminithermalis]SHJ86041.1 Permease of the drug/metabolite transporter (DMT) superfamily [Paramaledivibacter caminithermalis DSM 15212]